MADTAQTWAVRPFSVMHTQIPLPAGRSHAFSSTESLTKEYTSDGDPEDGSGTFRSGNKAGKGRLAHKPSFSKARFQWMKGELLGKGSYGRVYLGLNATTGEIMAVKQVELPKTASDRMNHQQLDVMKALKFESDTLKDLDHPNIVQYLGFEESRDFLSIFLEYVPGGTISALIRLHGRLQEEVTTSFLFQILRGLEYLHSRSILHRDLKADNILVEPTGVCKISDFGISKKANDLNPRPHTMMRGTVYWMAPEVLSSDGQGYDVKIDIWSVGCTAIEMWTGKRPWSDLSTMPVMMKLATEKLPPPLPSDVQLTPLAEAFRRDCFQIDPQSRPHAHTLKTHDYLKPSEGWVFDITNVGYSDRPPRPPSICQLPLPEKRAANDEQTARPIRMSPKQPSKPSLPPLRIPEYKYPKPQAKPENPRKPSSSRTAVPKSAPPPVGPPLVHVTPPGPRKTRLSLDDNRVPSSISESSQGRKKRPRILIISNPDEDSTDGSNDRPDSSSPKPNYIYTPPPLPDMATLATTSPNPETAKAPEAHAPFSATSVEGESTSRPALSSTLPDSFSTTTHSAASATRSPRPLPPSPAPSGALFTNRYSQYSGYRASAPTLRRPQTASQPKDTDSKTYKLSNTSQYHTSALNAKAIRKLPLSPPQLKSSASVAHLPSTSSVLPSRFLVKQKSVPDVSIFAFNPSIGRGGPSTGTTRSFSLDSDLESEFDTLMLSASPPRALPSEPSGSTSSAAQDSHGRRQQSLTLRPRAEDVYDDLESWFPHHDLDQSVDDAAIAPDAKTTEPLSEHRKADSRKSIRMIAKEQNSRSNVGSDASKRRTRLWNSDVQELKT